MRPSLVSVSIERSKSVANSCSAREMDERGVGVEGVDSESRREVEIEGRDGGEREGAGTEEEERREPAEEVEEEEEDEADALAAGVGRDV